MKYAARGLAVALLLWGAGSLGVAADPALSWSIQLLYGDDEIYPSVLASVTDAAIFPPRHPDQLGDPRGLIAAEIVAPSRDYEVTVTVAATEIFAESSIKVTLPQAGKTYRVAPPLGLRHADLLRLKHPIARELLTVTVEHAGRREEQVKPVRIWSVNDCLLYVAMPPWLARLEQRPLENLPWLNTHYLAAAYINENNPELVRRIIREAQVRRLVDRFDGYERRDPQVVRGQVKAIYDTLRQRGFKYSTLLRSSAVSDSSQAQRIRLPGDSVGVGQANCVDGTVLFASILTRLQLRAYLYINSHHAFLGVALDPAGAELIQVETTMVSTQPFEAAVKAGRALLKKAPQPVDLSQVRVESLLHRQDRELFFRVDVAAARAGGIVALVEPDARR